MLDTGTTKTILAPLVAERRRAILEVMAATSNSAAVDRKSKARQALAALDALEKWWTKASKPAAPPKPEPVAGGAQGENPSGQVDEATQEEQVEAAPTEGTAEAPKVSNDGGTSEIEKGSPDQPRVPAGSSGGGQWASSTGSFLKSVQEGNYSSQEPQPIGRGVYGAELVFYEDGSKGVRKDEFSSNIDDVAHMTQDGNREVAAYRISEQLGLNNVPPTEFHTVFVGHRSTVQRYVEDSKVGVELGTEKTKEWFKAHPEQVGKIILLDYLLGNSDRHSGNFLIDSANKLWAIDNGNAGSPWDTLLSWQKKYSGIDFEKAVRKNKKLISSWKSLGREKFDSWFTGVSEERRFHKDVVWNRLQEVIAAGGLPE